MCDSFDRPWVLSRQWWQQNKFGVPSLPLRQCAGSKNKRCHVRHALVGEYVATRRRGQQVVGIDANNRGDGLGREQRGKRERAKVEKRRKAV